MAPVKRHELGNYIPKSEEGLQNYATDFQELAQVAYPSLDPESLTTSTWTECTDDGTLVFGQVAS